MMCAVCFEGAWWPLHALPKLMMHGVWVVFAATFGSRQALLHNDVVLVCLLGFAHLTGNHQSTFYLVELQLCKMMPAQLLVPICN